MCKLWIIQKCFDIFKVCIKSKKYIDTKQSNKKNNQNSKEKDKKSQMNLHAYFYLFTFDINKSS